MSWSVVVPTNRPERFLAFLEAWQPLFVAHDVLFLLVEDGPERTPSLTRALAELPAHRHLCWQDIPDFVPRSTDTVRSAAFPDAYRSDRDYVLTLDDDTLPAGDLFAEYEASFETGAVSSEYFDVGSLTSSGLSMRGFPYRDRSRAVVAAQYGGWHGVLDYDAATELASPRGPESFGGVVVPLPKGCAVTGCIMNAAWRREYTPVMWQLPALDGRYTRIGDIWSGLFLKRTLDALGIVVVVNGRASVRHERASDPYESLRREAPSLWLNDNIWGSLATPTSADLLGAYREVTDSAFTFFNAHDPDYAEHFIHSRDRWLELYA